MTTRLPSSSIEDLHPVSLGAATKVWARIGLLSFGGPAAQIALMHKELVETRRWLSEDRYLHALNYCMLLPGPEAQQLAVYVGWLMHRTVGGLIAGVLFVLPGALTILALSILYAAYGQVPWVSALFFGLKAAVLAVVVEAVLRIGRRALKNRLMIGVAAAAFISIHFLNVPFPLIVAMAAALGLAAHRIVPQLNVMRPGGSGDSSEAYVIDRLIARQQLPHIAPNTGKALRTAAAWGAIWLAPVAASAVMLGPNHAFTQLGGFFSQAAVVTFGGAYSVLAYVAQEAVTAHGWLKPGEMLDGLALAETTPGPLIMVVQFVGYLAAFRAETGLSPLAAGVIGSVMTTWVTFAPCFLWIFVGAPYIEALQGNRWLHAGLSCITAAVVGVILNLSVWFAFHVVFANVGSVTYGPIHILSPDWSTWNPAALIIALASMAAMLWFKVGLGRTLLAAAAAGFAWRMLAG